MKSAQMPMCKPRIWGGSLETVGGVVSLLLGLYLLFEGIQGFRARKHYDVDSEKSEQFHGFFMKIFLGVSWFFLIAGVVCVAFGWWLIS